MPSSKREVFRGFENRSLNKVQTSKNTTDRTLNKDLYTELEIDNFKAFKSIKIDNLKRINVFFGPNNCGKTSILEAVYTHACGLNLLPFITQILVKRDDNSIRGAYDYGDKILNLFKNASKPPFEASIVAKTQNSANQNRVKIKFSPSGVLSELDPLNIGQGSMAVKNISQGGLHVEIGNLPTVFIGKWEIQTNNEKRSYDLDFPIKNTIGEQPFKMATMHDILSHRNSENDIKIYTQLKRYDLINEFVQILREEFTIVEGIDYIPFPDGVNGSVYIKTNDGRKLPLYSFGDGMRRWYYLIGQMLIYRDAVHCIEEIDATLHPSAQYDFSQLLYKYTLKYNNQLFITTHSIEFADAFLKAVYENAEENELVKLDESIRFYTLRPPSEENNYSTEIWSMSGSEAYRNRNDFKLELR